MGLGPKICVPKILKHPCPPYGVLWAARSDRQACELSKTKSSPEAPFGPKKNKTLRTPPPPQSGSIPIYHIFGRRYFHCFRTPKTAKITENNENTAIRELPRVVCQGQVGEGKGRTGTSVPPN